VPYEVGPEAFEFVQAGLKVEAVRMLAGGSAVLGSLIAANSSGFIVTHHAGDEEMKLLREHGRVARLPSKNNAAGNIILANDSAALIHPGLSAKASEAIAETLCVEVLEDLFELPVDVGTVNLGSPLVGSGVLANSHGYLAGEDTTGPELGRLEDALGFLV
jgi:translation initiation factor 6